MITSQDLLALKQRMLIAADAAHKIASTDDQFVMHDQEQYELVVGSLLALKADTRRLMAEHDILRGMFAERLADFFTEETDGRTGRAEAVQGVPGLEGVAGGEEKRDDVSVAPGPLLGVPPAGKRPRRSNPRRNRKSDKDAAGKLD